MRKFLGAAVLASLILCGCAASSPEAPALMNEEATKDQAPPAPEAEPVEMAGEHRSYATEMTKVFAEKGIPDRVVNEGELTILVYEGAEGEEYFAFRKEGEFFGYRLVPKGSP